MQKRHRDKNQYFKEQGRTTKKYVIPYIEEVKPLTKESRVLEIGCGEAGNLTPFIELGCDVVGVDLSPKRIENAKQFIQEAYPDASPTLITQNIYDTSSNDIGKFDIIFLRDVIEHIPEQEKFMGHMKSFLKQDGIVFFGFPPWRMPFGGHQQICSSKFLSKLPYFHLLPRPVYKWILTAFGEPNHTIKELLEIKATGISIAKFQKIVANTKYQFLRKTYFLINPNYETKFGLKPRKQFALLGAIPYFKDFFTTCMYSVIGDENK